MAQKIGRYEIERELGQGGMATVYLAHDPNTERQVVIKVIQPEYSHQPEFRARFRREAKTIAALEHPAIVPVHDYDEHDGQPFIVMRYMPGGSLLERLKQGRLSLPEIVPIVERIADALDEAHMHGIVHRDLKPGNILFDGKGNAYLSDFGIAKKIAETTSHLATTGFIGTPHYASPEQVEAKAELDGRSDVYSLSILVFELLSGQLPFKADTPMGVALAHLKDPIPNILSIRRDLPRACDSLIRRGLAKNRDRRFQTAGEMARELSRIAGAAGANRGRTASLPRAPTTPKTLPGASSPTRVPDTNARQTVRERLGLPGRRLWLWPAALVALIGLAALLGGLAALPGLLAGRVPVPTQANQLVVLAAATLNPTPLSTSGGGSAKVSEKDSMPMVWVPAGEFLRGTSDSDPVGYIDERPQRAVYLDAFWIDKTEVTNAMYAQCVAASACRAPTRTDSDTRQSYYGHSVYAHYPVHFITWQEAQTYCAWAGRRLPTEAEWEKAARGADGRRFPWGDDTPNPLRLNSDNVVGDTTEAGSYPEGASPYGALDMAGNVWEWVNDWYDAAYYTKSAAANPPGPTAGEYRVLRGGAWGSLSEDVRATYRYRFSPHLRRSNFGFRCALSP